MGSGNTLVFGLGAAGGAAVARWGTRSSSSRTLVLPAGAALSECLRPVEWSGLRFAVLVTEWPAQCAVRTRPEVLEALRARGLEVVELIGLLPHAPPMADFGAEPSESWVSVDFRAIPRHAEVIASMVRGLDTLVQGSSAEES